MPSIKLIEKMLSPAIFLIHFYFLYKKFLFPYIKNIFSCVQNKNFIHIFVLNIFSFFFPQKHDHLFATQNLSVPLKSISRTAQPNYSNKIPKFSTQNFLSFRALLSKIRPLNQNQ